MFRQSLRSIPQVNPNFWSFAITGAVSRPLILALSDLRAFPTQTIRAAVICSGASSDQPLVGEALWGGVPLEALLAELPLKPTARYARLHAADGYTAVLPLTRLAETLLATTMDGAPLPAEHGAPARLIAPGLYGSKMPKWIERIELTDSPAGGFWEARGGTLEGVAGLRAAILDAASAGTARRIRGIAYAGAQPLDALAVSIDGGGWQPVPFTSAAPFALTHWQIDWTPPGAGDYHVRVRASQGDATASHALVIQVR